SRGLPRGKSCRVESSRRTRGHFENRVTVPRSSPVRNATRSLASSLLILGSGESNVADGMYVGMAAAAAGADQLDSIADNLANAETPGYKASRPAFQSFLPPRGVAPGAAANMQDKIFAGVVATGTDLSQGPIRTTDNPLDIVPEGQLFL